MTLLGRQPVTSMWLTAYLRHGGPWTLTNGAGRWGRYHPDTGVVATVDPSADEALPAIAPSLARGTLVGYRVGRRAVIATPTSYIKVVRPKRLDALVTNHYGLRGVVRRLEVPDIIDVNTDGAVELTPVGGTSLHRLLRRSPTGTALGPVVDEIAAGIATLHSAAPPPQSPRRTDDNPWRWVDTVGRADPDLGALLAKAAMVLPSLPVCDQTLTHGDLHDKNIFWRPRQVGLIDLDSMAAGVPEDDVANLSVHLQLRALQSARNLDTARRLAARLVGSYRQQRPLNQERVNAVAAHTWFRLAAIYQFRSCSRRLVPELLRRAEQQHDVVGLQRRMELS